MKPILSLFVLCATLSLAACGSGPAKRVSAPTASVQELAVQADGSWRLLVRVQNFSNVSMTFDLLEAGSTASRSAPFRARSTSTCRAAAPTCSKPR